jgi:hypothetical protein
MVEQGFIKIERSLFNSALWPQVRKLTEIEFYAILKKLATFVDGSIIHRGRRIPTKRGQVVTSLDNLCQITRRSKKWIRSRLELFESEGLIIREKRYRFCTFITLCIYDPCGFDGPEKGTAKVIPEANSKDKHYKNVKNVNNNYSGKPEKIKRKRGGSSEHQRKVDLIISTVKSQLGCDCSGGKAGDILNYAGKERIGDAIVAIRKSKGQLDDGGDFTGMVKHQLQNRRLWTETDEAESKTITNNFNIETSKISGFNCMDFRR